MKSGIPVKIMENPLRRDGRVVEGTCLESRHTLTGIGGSNPSLSARKYLISIQCFSDNPSDIYWGTIRGASYLFSGASTRSENPPAWSFSTQLLQLDGRVFVLWIKLKGFLVALNRKLPLTSIHVRLREAVIGIGILWILSNVKLKHSNGIGKPLFSKQAVSEVIESIHVVAETNEGVGFRARITIQRGLHTSKGPNDGQVFAKVAGMR